MHETQDFEIRTDQTLRQELSESLGFLSWSELERHFARGVVVVASSEIDLLEVAWVMARDQRGIFSAWLAQGLVGPARDDEARRWQAGEILLRAIVLAPWVLVQEIRDPVHQEK